jgi:hypothetical protein
MTVYPIDIKVRHEKKNHEITNKFHNQLCGAKQVIVGIINKFFDSSPK